MYIFYRHLVPPGNSAAAGDARRIRSPALCPPPPAAHAGLGLQVLPEAHGAPPSFRSDFVEVGWELCLEIAAVETTAVAAAMAAGRGGGGGGNQGAEPRRLAWRLPLTVYG